MLAGGPGFKKMYEGKREINTPPPRGNYLRIPVLKNSGLCLPTLRKDLLIEG